MISIIFLAVYRYCSFQSIQSSIIKHPTDRIPYEFRPSGVDSYGDQSYSDLLSTNFFLFKYEPDDISKPLAFCNDRTCGIWNKVEKPFVLVARTVNQDWLFLGHASPPVALAIFLILNCITFVSGSTLIFSADSGTIVPSLSPIRSVRSLSERIIPYVANCTLKSWESRYTSSGGNNPPQWHRP